MTVAACCFVGYIVAGFTANIFATLGTSLLLLAIVIVILHKKSVKKYNP